MSLVSKEVLLALTVLLLNSVGGNSICDPEVVGDLSSHYPRGVPKDITSSLLARGPYSYIVLSNESTFALPNMKADCVGFKLLDKGHAIVTKWMEAGANQMEFEIEESQGAFTYMGPTDIAPKYKIYYLYCKNGVLLTYRCCDSCTADSDPSVGIAVADKLRYSPHTRLAVSEAFRKLHHLGLDKNVVELEYCSDKLA